MRTLLCAAMLCLLVGPGCSRQPADNGDVNHAEQASMDSSQDYQSDAMDDREDDAAPEPPPDPEVVRRVEALVDQLVDVSEPGFGYSLTFSGSEFLPYDEPGKVTTLVLGAAYSSRSETLREIVLVGAPAVPILLNHLDDGRTIRMEPVRGMMWIAFQDEYDFNAMTRAAPPEAADPRHWNPFGENQPKSHAITVGDLCFVALGQIVNREFSASRYQPSGGVVISSPTHSEPLRKMTLDEWGGLTERSHRKRLVRDFRSPDHRNRRIGAYLRLALYYPDAVEELVLRELSLPAYDNFAVSDFCRNRLDALRSARERRNAYEQFVAERGAHYAEGVRDALHWDLYGSDESQAKARGLLVELFRTPRDVKPWPRPRRTHSSLTEKGLFIAALTHDDSRRIGEAVRELLASGREDEYFAAACLRCLASRGYAEVLLHELKKIEPVAAESTHKSSELLKSIGTSREPTVRAKLLEFLQRTNRVEYFVAALPGVDPAHDDAVFAKAEQLVESSDDRPNRISLLWELGKRSPERSKATYQAYLAKGTIDRAETICSVLGSGHPLAIEILAPLMDDTRRIPESEHESRVCDRAALAISHAVGTDEFRFFIDANRNDRDALIAKLKAHCRQVRK